MEEELFTLHFGYSNSRRYAQARELANLCFRHVVIGEGRNVWHRVTFTEEQIDLMASLYDLVRGFFYPRLYDAPAWSIHAYLKNGRYEYAYATPGQRRRVREAGERLKAAHGGDAAVALAALTSEILHPIAEDLRVVSDALLAKGYLVFQSHTDPQVHAPKRPRECHPGYAAVRRAIDEGRLVEAVNLYYQALGDRPFGELHPELLYLKRLAVVPLLGRDILAFRSPSTWTDLIKDHIEEYCTCIDAAVQAAMSVGRESPLNVLCAGVPTLAELIERTEQRYHHQAYVWEPPYDWVKLDQTVVTAEHFGSFTCPTGRLFDRYVNPLVYHWSGDEMEEYVFENSVWTAVSPDFVEREILANGLTLAGVAAWKMRDRRVTIDSFTDPSQVELSKFAVSGIRYTGRVHRIVDVPFYEADLLRKDIPKAGVGSSLQDWAGEILREAENLLRERHGLPRIGEGWVSETLLFALVQEVLPDAIQHARPRWLIPQHLDIFVPSVHLAIEYQGRQHFEPIDFFGGEATLAATTARDERKREKCSARGVHLLYWNHDEPITRETLVSKLGLLEGLHRKKGKQ